MGSGFRVWRLGFIELVKCLGAKNVLTESFDRTFWQVSFLNLVSELVSREAGLGWDLGLGFPGLGWLGWARLGAEAGWLGRGRAGWAGLGWAGVLWLTRDGGRSFASGT